MDLHIQRCRSWIVDAIKPNVVIHITNANNITTSPSTTNNINSNNNNNNSNNNNNNNLASTSLITSMPDLSNQFNKIANGIIGIRIPFNL